MFRRDRTAHPVRAARAVRPARLAVAVAAVLLALVTAAPPALAVTYTVRFEAAQHLARQFDAAGHVTATKTVTLQRPSGAPASERRAIAGYGVQFRISAGLFAGWWVRESRVAYVRGPVGGRAYSPPVAVTFPAGTYEAYRFDAAGVLREARGRVLSAASSAHADRTRVIDGRPYLHVVDGTWAGWWLPGSVTAPRRITCSVPTPPRVTTGRIVHSVWNATGRVALTFDMGGRLDPAVAIMNRLLIDRVCATIFPTGAAAETATGRAVLAIIRAHPELFEVGNHTDHHCNLRDGGGGSACPATRPSPAFVVAELEAAEATIQALAGRTSKPYWRPPYGAVDTALVTTAASAGYPITVMWSIDTIDWRPVADGGPTAWGIASKVTTNARTGSIVLNHLGGWNTYDALPATLEGLAARGYQPTSLSGLYR